MKLRNIISAVAAAAVAASAASLCAFADDQPAGYVYFMAEKTTLGQGFEVEPVKVPYYEGETGLDIVERAAEIKTEDTGYGAFITAVINFLIMAFVLFCIVKAMNKLMEMGKHEEPAAEEPAAPEAVAGVCKIASGRTEEGWLSAYDYTAESGWTYFVNDEYAQVGIADYTPADGDVVVFSFTVYGYGADLGVDNSSWGGAAALKEQVKTAELVKLFADNKDLLNGSDEQAYAFTAAGEALAQYESTQEDVDNAVDRLENILGTETLVTEESPSADAAAESEDAIDAADDGASGEKGSPSTGVESVAVAVAVVILAGAGIAMSKKQ